MQKLERPWEDIASELRTKLARCELSTKELQRHSGADYFAIRRIRQGTGLNKKSKNAIQLCSFFAVKMQTSRRQSAWHQLERQLDKLRDAPEDVVQFVTTLVRASHALRRKD